MNKTFTTIEEHLPIPELEIQTGSNPKAKEEKEEKLPKAWDEIGTLGD